MFSISGGTLPTGLSLNTSTGAITGTPTDTGSSILTFKVTDSLSNSATANCSILPLPLTLACPASTGQVGVPYSSAVVASGGTPPYTFSISGVLPLGLTFLPSGVIGGTSSDAGAFNFTFTVVDSSGNPATNTVTTNCGITFGPENTGHCTYSWAFYANHDSVVKSLIPSGLTVGTVAYSLGGIEEILAHKPVAGNGLVSLAHQLIAAQLNILVGSTVPASVPIAIYQANSLIGALNVPGSGLNPGYLSPSQTAGLETTLDSFNQGDLGSGSCS
jgi:hypothetical protein